MNIPIDPTLPPEEPGADGRPSGPLPALFWFVAEGETQRMGLEEGFLEGLEAEIVALELAPRGTALRAGDTFGLITLVTRTIDLRAPRAFRVVEVNAVAEQDPRLVRYSPYAKGWLLRVVLAD